ncbi:cytochrome P450 [Nonomuraea sp. NPDC050680]|uniref:cytochrome P450 n=1 Tax=Nonomuraea sp. NPDC050680 TaxID=3154630 RepID=UPI0033E65B19
MSDISTLPLYMRRTEFSPAAELAEVREKEGITRVTTSFGIDAWLVTRYADTRAVLGDAERFSNARQTVFQPPGATEEELKVLRAGNLLSFDPPEHSRLRRFLTPEFTIRRMKRLEPRIKDIVEEHLDAMERAGSPVDLVSSFALPIPSLVICELLGVPYADRTEFQRRTGRLLDVSLPMDERLKLQQESRAYMTELVTGIQADPGEELLGMLVREHGDDLTTNELIGIGNLLLIAGHETTSNMLGLGTLALLRQPDQLDLLMKEPERIEATVEELMRWLSILHASIGRVCTTETEVAGQTIQPGDLVMCSLPLANRDPAFMDEADELDITRGAPGHLAFGHGVHHCLGAPLARMEMRIAFQALFQRFPGLRTVAPIADFRSFHVVYGLASLEVAW